MGNVPIAYPIGIAGLLTVILDLRNNTVCNWHPVTLCNDLLHKVWAARLLRVIPSHYVCT